MELAFAKKVVERVFHGADAQRAFDFGPVGCIADEAMGCGQAAPGELATCLH